LPRCSEKVRFSSHLRRAYRYPADRAGKFGTVSNIGVHAGRKARIS
jgi:hypothetical protein